MTNFSEGKNTFGILCLYIYIYIYNTYIYITLYITLFFFLARFFIAGCTGICYLTNSSVAGGVCFTGIMAFPFFFAFGVHVEFMETFYVCVYIKTISLHKVIYTNLFICYKAEVYSKEQNLHHCFFFFFFFFFLAPFHITFKTDIGAHKPWLL